MTPTARQVLVTGRVQGVAFRWSTLERARALGALGWVRNLRDGRVEAWVEGEPDVVEELVTWLRGGPRHARVETLEVHEREPEGHVSFEIR